MIKVTDYIASLLVRRGIRHVFMVTGGGAMHLNNSLGKHPDLHCIFQHHEQACAMAAEGYARVTGRLAVVNVTTGPGGLNTLTGVLGQWTDSVPVLYLSGQVKFETTIQSCPELKLRQLGDQEVDIVRIVQPITKFAHCLNTPNDVRWVLEKAIYLAMHGRPGPVWIDIPMNVQGAVVGEALLVGFSPPAKPVEPANGAHDQTAEAYQLLQEANRPVLVAGHGIRVSGAREDLLRLARRMPIPLLGTFNAVDLVPSDHAQFIGRIGSVGDRAGNFALQNADLILSVGTRNNIRQVSYGWQSFGRAAKKIVVDIDPAELQKPTLVPEVPIEADAGAFLRGLEDALPALHLPDWSSWLAWCQERRRRYPVVLPQHAQSSHVNLYYFIKTLTEASSPPDIFVAGDGSACVGLFQAGVIKDSQRVFWNSGCAAMGYDLPAAIGACVGSARKNTVCLAGDGSLQLNIQELQTVAHHQLPIKIFVLNNGGYLSIKQTQRNFFGLPYVGCDENSGLSFPDVSKLAEAYGLRAGAITTHDHLEEKLRAILASTEPHLIDVQLETDYAFTPKLSSEKKPDGRIVSKPLEDMYPFLDRKEFEENMLIPVLEED